MDDIDLEEGTPIEEAFQPEPEPEAEVSEPTLDEQDGLEIQAEASEDDALASQISGLTDRVSDLEARLS